MPPPFECDVPIDGVSLWTYQSIHSSAYFQPVFPRMEFVTPDCSASSLPQAFEEYEDEEHHVLYKTLAEAGGKGSSAPTVSGK